MARRAPGAGRPSRNLATGRRAARPPRRSRASPGRGARHRSGCEVRPGRDERGPGPLVARACPAGAVAVGPCDRRPVGARSGPRRIAAPGRGPAVGTGAHRRRGSDCDSTRQAVSRRPGEAMPTAGRRSRCQSPRRQRSPVRPLALARPRVLAPSERPSGRGRRPALAPRRVIAGCSCAVVVVVMVWCPFHGLCSVLRRGEPRLGAGFCDLLRSGRRGSLAGLRR